MRKSKLYLVLKEFDKYEQNRCRKYIQSPYFNRSEKLCDLYEILIDCINTSETAPEAEEVLEKLHPGEVIKDSRWRKYCSDLLKLVEGYLIQEEFENDKINKSAYLMDAASKRNNQELNDIALKKSEKTLNTIKNYYQEYYFDKYFIEKKKYEFQKTDRQRAEISNISDIMNNLDNYFISKKLKFYCDILSRKSTVSYDYDVKLMEELLSFLSKSNEDELEAIILIYYKLVLMINDFSKEESYYEIKDLLEKHAVTFPKEEAYVMYSFVVNYCTRKLNAGNAKFWREYFDIHNQLLETEIIIVDGELNVGIYKNLVATGLRLGEIKWTENFLKNYKNYLPKDQRENAATLNYALFYFHKKEYGDVIRLLREVEYEDFVYNLSAKRLLLMTYYETDEQDPLYFLIDSWRAYLYRQKSISSNFKISYSNLLKFTKKLLKAKFEGNSQLSKLKEEISTTPTASRSWLLEKIAELE